MAIILMWFCEYCDMGESMEEGETEADAPETCTYCGRDQLFFEEADDADW